MLLFLWDLSYDVNCPIALQSQTILSSTRGIGIYWMIDKSNYKGRLLYNRREYPAGRWDVEPP